MNIIHFTHELPQASGVATFVREVSAALEDIGVESRIVLDPKELPREPEAGTILHIHGMWKPVYHQAAKWAKANGVKIVWSTHGMTAPWSMAHKRWKKLIAWWLYQKRDLQSAALIHSTVEQEAEWNRKLGLGVGGREIVVPLGTHLPENSFNAGACGTRKIRPDLNAYAPSASQPDGISTSGLVVSDFSQRSANGAEGAEVRAKGYGVFAEGLPEEELPSLRTLLFIGRIYPVKALDRLIEAFSRAHVPGWQLRLVGPDQSGHTAELIALCNRLGLSFSDQNCDIHSTPTPSIYTSTRPTVEFAGPKFGPDLAAEYAACDILALVSHTENFGATVVDAMAHGKPVITSTNTPWREVAGDMSSSGCAEGSGDRAKEAQVGAAELAEAPEEELPTPAAPGSAGWWVDNDVDSLTDCLRAALTTPPSTLAQMGARGRSLVESKYTWRAVASRLSTAYAEIVG